MACCMILAGQCNIADEPAKDFGSLDGFDIFVQTALDIEASVGEETEPVKHQEGHMPGSDGTPGQAGARDGTEGTSQARTEQTC